MYGCMDVWMDGCMDVWMYGFRDGCMDVWMYVCMYLGCPVKRKTTKSSDSPSGTAMSISDFSTT
jgi:hypothetical protein